MTKREFLAASLGVAATAWSGVRAASNVRVRKAKTTKLFKAPEGLPNAISVTPEGLWIGEQKLAGEQAKRYGLPQPKTLDEAAWLVDWNGKLLKTVTTPSRNTSGMAVGGGYVWMIANAPPQGVFQVDMNSKLVSHRQIPLGAPGGDGGGSHGGLWHDGKLWLSVALFSQFNCIDPVYAAYDAPLSGSFDAFEEVFARAARQLEAEVANQLATSRLGDGFTPVASTVASRSWEELDLRVPERSTGLADAAMADLELPTQWAVAEATDGAPRLVFNFPPPLERYSGEVGELEGTLDLGDAATLDDATGWVKAITASVTMGEETLDVALREKMIFAPKFPDARFELESLEATDGDPSELRFGYATHVAASGKFILMGVPIPLAVIGTIEPIIAEDGAPRLQVVVSYRIRLEDPFGIAGPDGPAPANDTLIFNMSFAMEEASASS